VVAHKGVDRRVSTAAYWKRRLSHAVLEQTEVESLVFGQSWYARRSNGAVQTHGDAVQSRNRQARSACGITEERPFSLELGSNAVELPRMMLVVVAQNR
jgi:hypothetical protein